MATASAERINTPATNRERVANHENIGGYVQQEMLVEKWKQGHVPPRELLFGSLPDIAEAKHRAASKDIEEEVDYEC